MWGALWVVVIWRRLLKMLTNAWELQRYRSFSCLLQAEQTRVTPTKDGSFLSGPSETVPSGQSVVVQCSLRTCLTVKEEPLVAVTSATLTYPSMEFTMSGRTKMYMWPARHSPHPKVRLTYLSVPPVTYQLHTKTFVASDFFLPRQLFNIVCWDSAKLSQKKQVYSYWSEIR